MDRRLSFIKDRELGSCKVRTDVKQQERKQGKVYRQTKIQRARERNRAGFRLLYISLSVQDNFHVYQQSHHNVGKFLLLSVWGRRNTIWLYKHAIDQLFSRPVALSYKTKLKSRKINMFIITLFCVSRMVLVALLRLCLLTKGCRV